MNRRLVRHTLAELRKVRRPFQNICSTVLSSACRCDSAATATRASLLLHLRLRRKITAELETLLRRETRKRMFAAHLLFSRNRLRSGSRRRLSRFLETISTNCRLVPAISTVVLTRYLLHRTCFTTVQLLDRPARPLNFNCLPSLHHRQWITTMTCCQPRLPCNSFNHQRCSTTTEA